MASTSSSNSRVIEVINFLAAHPTEAFTLTELASRLSLSHGSAHRVLSAMTEARYLTRHPKHKTYALGMALVAVGQAALAKHQALAIARREMMRLADQLDVQCIATVIVEDEMLLVAKEGISQTHDGLGRVGERRPFIPPLALAQVAWANAPVMEAYLNKAPQGVSADMRVYIVKAAEVIRKRGYSIAAIGPGLSALRKIIDDHVDNYRDEKYWTEMQTLISQLSENEIQLLSLDDIHSVRVGYIAAPVFSPTGEVVLEISLTGIPDHLSVTELTRYAQRLRAAAAVVTSETHGRMPRI